MVLVFIQSRPVGLLHSNDERMLAMKTRFHFTLVTQYFSFVVNIDTTETAPVYLMALKLILEAVILAVTLNPGILLT